MQVMMQVMNVYVLISSYFEWAVNACRRKQLALSIKQPSVNYLYTHLSGLAMYMYSMCVRPASMDELSVLCWLHCYYVAEALSGAVGRIH